MAASGARPGRRELVALLLSHYSDVLAGLRDRAAGDTTHVPLMCRAWNSPGYQELERLLPLLRADAPAAYRAVVAMFVHPSFRRRAVCPRCRAVGPPHAIGQLHKHGRRSVVLVPRMVRTPLYPVEPEQVEAAISWLEGHWRGEPFIPEELLPLVAA